MHPSAGLANEIGVVAGDVEIVGGQRLDLDLHRPNQRRIRMSWCWARALPGDRLRLARIVVPYAGVDLVARLKLRRGTAGAESVEIKALSRLRSSSSSSTMNFLAAMIRPPCRLNPTRHKPLFAVTKHESN